MQRLESQDSKDVLPDILPALAVRDVILFPKHTYPLFVGREKSKVALTKSIPPDNWVFLPFQLDPDNEYPAMQDLLQLGVLAKILESRALPDQRIKVSIEATDRAKIIEDYSNKDYLSFKIEIIPDPNIVSDSVQAKIELLDRIISKYLQFRIVEAKLSPTVIYEHILPPSVAGSTYLPHQASYSPSSTTFNYSASPASATAYSPEVFNLMANDIRLHKQSLGAFADSIANYCNFSREEKITCLTTIEIEERADFVYNTLLKKIRKEEIISDAEKRALEKFRAEYRGIFLQEELRAILAEMGDTAPLSVVKPIFRGRGFIENKKLVFVLMPFEEKFRPIYTEIIKPTVEKLDLKCTRSDDIYGPKSIIEDIWRLINEAKIIIADVTARNANVFYEIGLCHAIGKDVIILTQSLSDVPFDLRHYRCIQYEDSVKGTKQLEKDLFKSIEVLLFNGTKASSV